MFSAKSHLEIDGNHKLQWNCSIRSDVKNASGFKTTVDYVLSTNDCFMISYSLKTDTSDLTLPIDLNVYFVFKNEKLEH